MNHSKVNTGLNSLTLLFVAGIAWFTQEEIRDNRQSRATVYEIKATVAGMQTELKDFKDNLTKLVTISAFTSALSERDAQILELKKEVGRLQTRLNRPGQTAPQN